jgi:hypothetical protein
LFDEAELMERVDNDLEFLADTVQMLETDGRAAMVEPRPPSPPAMPGASTPLYALGDDLNFCSTGRSALALDVEKAGKAGDAAGGTAASAKLENSKR